MWNVSRRQEVTFMLRKMEDRIKNCLDHAAKARSRADETPDPVRKAEYVSMELNWIRLARSYEFAQSLKSFLQKPSSTKATVWHHLILEAYEALMLDAHEEDVDQRTASLVRHGPYEVRLVELPRNLQAGTEQLWLELFDHSQQRTIDSYGGHTLVDITAAADPLCSKAKELNQSSN
jgi:hypothetical protein